MSKKLVNQDLINILEREKREKEDRFQHVVEFFTMAIDRSFEEETYKISSDGKYIMVECESQSPVSKYPKELLTSISNTIKDDRGFEDVTIAAYPGNDNYTSRFMITLVPKYKPTIKEFRYPLQRQPVSEEETRRIIHTWGLNHL